MAIATTVIKNDSGLYLTTAEPILYASNSAVLSEIVENVEAYVKKQGLFPSQSPTLVPASPSNVVPNGGKMSLEDYMNAILAAMVTLQADMTQVDTAQNKAADSFIQLSIAQANKAQQDFKDYEAAVEAAKHQSFWQKLCGYLVGAIMAIVGIISCNPELLIAGSLSIAMTATGGSDKVNQFIQGLTDNSGLRLLADIGFGVAVAICLSGLSASADVFLESALPKTVAKAAEDSGAEMANLGANDAEDASANAVQSPAAEEPKSLASQVFAKMKSNAFSSLGQSTMVVNPFIDGVGLMIDAINEFRKMQGKSQIGDSLKQEISEIAGMVLAIVAALGAGFASGTRAAEHGDLVDVLAEKNGIVAAERFKNFILFPLKYIARPGFSIAGSAMGIEAGESYLEQARVYSDLGVVQSAQTMFQMMTTIANAMITQTQDGFNQLAATFSDMNSRWGSYTDAYVTAAEIMG